MTVNNDRINAMLAENAQIQAPLNFDDLMKRIRDDNGNSTAPMYKKSGNPVRKFISAAAAVVLVVTLSAFVIVIAGNSGMFSSESESVCDSEAFFSPSYGIAEDSECNSEVYMETESAEEVTDDAEDEPDAVTSESDVSESDAAKTEYGNE